MKTKLTLQSLLLLGVTISIVSQSFAQESSTPTSRQRISNMLPRPSLPSWAKGPGFEAAKKWWKAGRDESVLDRKEKRAFRRFKKKFAIGAIVSAIMIALGGRYYQIRKQRAAQAAAQIQATLEAQAGLEAALKAEAQAAQQVAQERLRSPQAMREQARSICINTMAGQIMHPQSFEIKGNTITFAMPASWIERAKEPPAKGSYSFEIKETKNNDGSYSYTAQATAPNKQTLELQIRETWDPSCSLGLEFKKTVITPYLSNKRFPQFEE